MRYLEDFEDGDWHDPSLEKYVCGQVQQNVLVTACALWGLLSRPYPHQSPAANTVRAGSIYAQGTAANFII